MGDRRVKIRIKSLDIKNITKMGGVGFEIEIKSFGMKKIKIQIST